MQTRSQTRNANLTETPSAVATPSTNREQAASRQEETADNMSRNQNTDNQQSDTPAAPASTNQETTNNRPANVTVTQTEVINRLLQRVEALEQEARLNYMDRQQVNATVDDTEALLSDVIDDNPSEENDTDSPSLRSSQITLPSAFAVTSVRQDPTTQQNIMVQNVNLDKLEEITYEAVSDFLHEFIAVRQNYPALRIAPYICRVVKEALDHRGVNTK